MIRCIPRPVDVTSKYKSKYGYYWPTAHSHDRIRIPGWVPITEALDIARVGVVPVEINYYCLGAFVSLDQ